MSPAISVNVRFRTVATFVASIFGSRAGGNIETMLIIYTMVSADEPFVVMFLDDSDPVKIMLRPELYFRGQWQEKTETNLAPQVQRDCVGHEPSRILRLRVGSG